MKTKVISNYFWTVGYQLVALLVPLIITPYISRVLGVSNIGNYSYSYSIMRYFWLLSALGIATYGARSIGIEQDNRINRTAIFWNIFSLKVILSIIFLVLYYIIVFFVFNNNLLFIIQGIYLFSVLLDITWLYQGMEDFRRISIRNTIIKILSVICVFILVKDENDLITYTLILAVFQVASNLSLFINLNKYIDKVNINKLRPFDSFKTVLLLFIPSIATQIFAVLDKSMIGWLSNSSLENGFYEQAYKIVDMSIVIITTLSSVMIPLIAKEFSKGNKKIIEKSMNISLNFVFLISIPLSVGLICISNNFVPWFFGKDFYNATKILKILSLLYIFIGVSSITGTQYLVSTKQEKKHVLFLIIGGIVNVLINLSLIPHIGACGAAFGSVFGEVVISLGELLYLKITKQFDFINVIKKIHKPIISALVMGIIITIIKSTNFSNGVITVFSIIIGGLTYFITLIILKDETINLCINKLKEKLIRR